MLKRLRVTPLAAESLGVRSMCTLVESPDVTVLLDAGVSLAPYRFSLLPHPIEFQTIARLRMKIAQAADKSQVVTISHYHFDHHTPSYEDWLVNWTEAAETAKQIYLGKVVLMKNPKNKINGSQRHRAWMFQKTGGKFAQKLSVADGQSFSFGETAVRFSEAVPHGSEDSLGWVLMTVVEFGGERFLHAPDVQGPVSPRALEIILGEKPDVVMVGGPPSYLENLKIGKSQLQRGFANLKAVVETVPVTLLEHHALRDERWREKAEVVYIAAERAGHRVLTAAEYLGEDNLFLEFRRKQLYEENPPSKEFRAWMKLGSNEISRVKPPL
jgi:predicted metallo-beta-lactamase superfamily hydrolase